ncbi:MAG: DNA alkylation repair protein, partial [Bacteroidota bacterium]
MSEILEYLKDQSAEKYKANVVKLGVPEQNSLGVPIPVLRKLAKELKPSNHLAKQLWDSGYHEARLLGVLLVDPYTVDPKWAVALVDDVVSWDLCDHLCKGLLYFLPEHEDLILSWQKDHRLYHKRTAFVLIATAVVYDKEMAQAQIAEYLEIIRNHEADARPHAKKAVSWALREIGKRDIASLQKARPVAEALAQDA